MLHKLKKKKIKILLISIAAAALVIIISVFTGHRRSGSSEDMGAFLPSDADLSLSRVRQTSVREGVTEWSLDAGSARLLTGSQKAEFDDLSVTFFLKDGETVRLTADQGILKTDANDMEVSGNVVVINRTYVLKTERLDYHHAGKRVVSRAPVEITGDTLDVKADSLDHDIENRKTLLEGKVRAIFHGKNVL
jgi:LPS export ABC transporter protein LptC